MADASNQQIIERYRDATVADDDDAVGALRHPDWTTEWPQSGERVRGHANERTILRRWPGGRPDPGEHIRVVGSEDRWVVTPSFTFERMVGGGDTWWLDGNTQYPDGTTWFFVALLTLRDGLVFRETWYFAPPLEAPPWRADWVEPID